MTALRRFLALLFILALAILGCGFSVDLGTPMLFLQDHVATQVAQTLEAFTQQALMAIPTSTPLPSATATPSQPPLPPTLSVSAATECRSGPSGKYGLVITIRPGTIVTVVGKDVLDNYWIIAVPGYPASVCWLSGQYAQLSGDTANLPSPATPQPSMYVLSEPRNLRISCSSADDDWTVVLSWTNTEPDQAGVRVFRNGRQIATLGSGARSYTDASVHHRRQRSLTYGVQAYNGKWVSSIVGISLRRCD